VARIIRWTNDHFVIEMPVISVILVIMIALALVTNFIGVHTVLGAFAAGIMIGQSPISANLICYDISRLAFFFCAEAPPDPQRFRSNGLRHKKGEVGVQQPFALRVARRRTHASGWASGVVWN
jgi:hypothetical protein